METKAASKDEEPGVIANLPSKIRNKLQLKVNTHPTEEIVITKEEVQKVANLVEQYKSSVFDENKVGKLKTKPIHLDYEENFSPRQPRYYNIPFHYQKPLSKLLQFLREQGVITDVDPRNSYKCIMNVVITDKKDGNIRMNVDASPMNPGLKRSKIHVETPHEIRHELKSAQVFSELSSVTHRRTDKRTFGISNP